LTVLGLLVVLLQHLVTRRIRAVLFPSIPENSCWRFFVVVVKKSQQYNGTDVKAAATT